MIQLQVLGPVTEPGGRCLWLRRAAQRVHRTPARAPRETSPERERRGKIKPRVADDRALGVRTDTVA